MTAKDIGFVKNDFRRDDSVVGLGGMES
jgi:hypothetical protein